ncbi:hypothetical protein QL285_083475 [Trifolium repens]|nr:hypothetical protein QL285_083475 [Trifolium repens]
MPPPKLESRQPRQFILESDGSIRIRMNRSQSMRIEEPISSRASTSSRRSIDSTININFAGVDFTPNIPQPIYETERRSDSPPMSPTASQILNIIELDEEFEIDKAWIKEDFEAYYNKEKRDWYFGTFEKIQTDYYLKKFYDYIRNKRINVYFFTWFEEYCIEQKIINPFIQTNYLNVTTKTAKKWTTLTNKTIEAVHPPLEAIKIESHNVPLEAYPFKSPENADIGKVQSQLNFSNTILSTIADQLDRVETQMSHTPITHNKIESYKDFPLDPQRPIYKLINVPEKDLSEVKLGPRKDELVDNIMKRLSDLSINGKAKAQVNILEKDEDNSEINRIRKHMGYQGRTRNYYPRPSFPDLQFEESRDMVASSYTGNSIIEWNIDGHSEQNILNTIQEMTMAATAFKTMGENTDKKAAIIIITGFTGQLKGWWDNIISPEEKLAILEAKKLDPTTGVLGEEDAVNTLLYTITKHFVGDPAQIQDRAADQLANLYCPTMSDYRWYKDMFLSKLCNRPDGGADYWKERFIAGLPRLLAEKVRMAIKAKSNGVIPYSILTFGQISSQIIETGIGICTDFKIQNKIKSEVTQSKKELGSFCEQFGIEPIRAPSKKARKNYAKPPSSYKPYKKRKHHYRKNKELSEDKNYKTSKGKKKKFQNNKSDIKCFKCGRFGHYAKTCRVKQKINEIHNLDISDQLKENLINVLKDIMLNDTSSVNSEESSYEEDDLNQILTSSESEISSEEDCCLGAELCTCDKCIKSINVITSDQATTLISILKDMPESSQKEEFMLQIKNIIEREEKNKNTVQKIEFKEIMNRFKPIITPQITIKDLQNEISFMKQEIDSLKAKDLELEIKYLELKGKQIISNEVGTSNNNQDISDPPYIATLNRMITHKWLCPITLLVKDQRFDLVALIDSGADMNCIQEGLIPTKFYEKTLQGLSGAGGHKLQVQYKLTDAKICKDHVCYKTHFLLVKNIHQHIILGTPFLSLLYPFTVSHEAITSNALGREVIFRFFEAPRTKDLNTVQNLSTSTINLISQKKKHINMLNKEIQYKRIENQLESKNIKDKIILLQQRFEKEICSEHPNAFWDRKKHIVSLPYEPNFNERSIPTKARPIQMNQQYLEYCKKEIKDYLDKKLIRPSKSPWSCTGFYVNNPGELERGAPRLVINYKPLNKVLQWIRYPIPNKKDLIGRLSNSIIFSKFDLKSGYYQIQLEEKDKYKTAFVVPFGHYEWNVMPLGLKNAPSEFQHIMNDILNDYQEFSIVYLDDILVFSKSLNEHFDHLEKFFKIIKENGLVLSARKMKLFQVNVRFLGFNIYQGTITPISRAIEFGDKFPDELKDKTQLQRFLGCVNYVADFIPNIRIICLPLFKRLKKNPPPWDETMSQSIRQIKQLIKRLPCLGIPDPQAFLIVETDSSDAGFGGILKQRLPESSIEQVVRYYSGTWNPAQLNYSTIKKEVLAIVLCITKFQDDLFSKKFLLRSDCKAAKEVLQKDVKNLVSKHIFARWQALLSCFDFDIEHIKGEKNSLPDFLTREFLQGKHEQKR